MQLVYGLVWFENTNPQKMKEVLSHTTIDGIKYAFYDQLEREGKNIPSPGAIIYGAVGDHWTSQKIVSRLRYHLGLPEQAQNCDLSIESEDRIFIIKDGRPQGIHATIRIAPPHDITDIINLAREIEKEGVTTLTVRTAERNANGTVTCIDFSANKKQEELIETAARKAKEQGLAIKSITTAKIE